jgi:hypothetical protein
MSCSSWVRDSPAPPDCRCSEAKFKGIKPMDDKGGFCGWVNAKNSYGGYEGFSVFYVSGDGKVAILPPDRSESNLC